MIFWFYVYELRYTAEVNASEMADARYIDIHEAIGMDMLLMLSIHRFVCCGEVASDKTTYLHTYVCNW